MTISVRAGADNLSGALQVGGVDRLVFNSDGSVTLPNTTVDSLVCSSLASTAAGPLGAFRNRIINGAATVRQWDTVAITSAGFSGPDRWVVNQVGTGISVTQSTGTLTTPEGEVRNCITQTINTATTNISGSNYFEGLSQRIEADNCYDLSNKPVVISFVFNTNVSGTYSVSLRGSGAATTGAVTKSYVSSFNATANVPVRVTRLVPAGALDIRPGSHSGMCLNIGAVNTGTFQAPSSNAWLAGNYMSVAGATNWTIITNSFISATEIQVEQGTTYSGHEHRPTQVEHMLAFRYFYRPDSLILDDKQANGSMHFAYLFPTAMRVTPSITSANQGQAIAVNRYSLRVVLDRNAGRGTYTFIAASAEL